jgi:hypothetical protein
MARRRNFLNRLPLGPVFALMFGAAVAIVIAAMPQWRFEQAVDATRLGSIVSVAVPPLGIKARLLAIMLGFALVASLVWLGATLVQRLIDGPRARADADDADDELDLADYADTLPPVDAPRRPIFADKELGAPFMSDEALAGVTAPLVLTPSEPVEPVLEAPDTVLPVQNEVAVSDPTADSTLEAPLDVAEFELPPASDDEVPDASESSIDTLIKRLEAGLARRAGPPPNPPAPAASPIGMMRDWMQANRETGEVDESGSARALDTLQRLAARRMAG